MAQRLHNPHPGQTLKETIADLGISQSRLSAGLNIPRSRIAAIIEGRQGITAAIALKLGQYLGTSSEYWLNLQQLYDTEKAAQSD